MHLLLRVEILLFILKVLLTPSERGQKYFKKKKLYGESYHGMVDCINCLQLRHKMSVMELSTPSQNERDGAWEKLWVVVDVLTTMTDL